CLAHLAPMHALHRTGRADRHEGGRPHHAMRRGQPAGAGAAVGGKQFEMVGKAHEAAYRVTPASVATSLSAKRAAKAVDAPAAGPYGPRAMMTATKTTTK